MEEKVLHRLEPLVEEGTRRTLFPILTIGWNAGRAWGDVLFATTL